MKKAIVFTAIIILGVSTFVYCADLFIGQKKYRFKYEVVTSPEKPTYVVKRKPYRNPLVVGFSINKDGSIKAIDPETENQASNPAMNEGIAAAQPVTQTASPETPRIAETTGNPLVQTPRAMIVHDDNIIRKKVVTVYFDRGSSMPGTDIAKTLNSLSIDITKGEFEVHGFTCPLGSMKINERLAQQRAETVARKINMLGGRVRRTVGKPMCCYESHTDFTKNRRAEIYLITSN